MKTRKWLASGEFGAVSVHDRRTTHLSLVNFTGKCKGNRHRYPLLQQAADLTSAVDLSTERRSAEVVLGSDGGCTVFARTTHHSCSRVGSELKVHVNTGFNTLGQLPPVRGSEDTLSLELSAGNPVASLVSAAVGKRSFGTSAHALTLPDSFETKSQAGCDGLQVASDENSGQTTIQERWVEGLDRCREIVTSVVIVKLQQTLGSSRHDLSVGLGDQLRGPTIVTDGSQRAIASEVALRENLFKPFFFSLQPNDCYKNIIKQSRFLTLGLPYMAEKAYGGRFPDPPMEKACDKRKRGDMLKAFVKSARRPVNMKLDSKTSFCTSLAMLSTVPGLGRPRASLRSENVLYASFNTAPTALSVKKEKAEEESAIVMDYQVCLLRLI